jgi:hypothetical protein
VVVAALAASLAAASPASAVELLRKDVTVGSAVDRSCTDAKLGSGAGYAQQTVTMPVAGSLVARLTAASGDWDVAVFDAGSGETVAGAASRGSREVAGGLVVAGK